jgi:group I intron endonuclease
LDYKELPRESGVYKIEHIDSGRCYIGSSKNIRARCYEHIRTLRKAKHHSQYLQRAWNKYEEDSFQIRVLELCSIEDLLNKEQHYIDTLLPEYNMTKEAGSPLGVVRSKEFCQGMSKRVREWWGIKENKERMVRAAKERLQCEDALLASKEAALEYNKLHPEKGIRHSKVMKEKFEDPEYYKKFCEKMAERSSDEELRATLSSSITNKWKDPIYRRKNSAITDEQAIEILKLKRTKLKHKEIAEIVGCQKSVVDNISSNKTYKHIDRETLQIDPEYI